MKMFFTALCFIGLMGCTGNSAKQAEATTPSNDTTTAQSQEPKAVVNTNNSYQNTALYLAGLAKTVEANVPGALTDNNAYKLFSDTMNIGFSNMEKNRFVKMREWAKTELAPELASPKTVFYPFQRTGYSTLRSVLSGCRSIYHDCLREVWLVAKCTENG
jgi:hypothetical protein